MKLFLTILLLGWLDLDTWDGLLTWTALIVGFYFLLRSSEFLRKAADPDAQKCPRVRNFMFPTNGGDDDCDEDLDCDEVLILHEPSKNYFLGQGTDSNTKRCKHDARLCIPPASNRLRHMKPAHFREKNENAFMFTLGSGLVIHKDSICRLLRNGALALGLDPRVVSTHSLRAPETTGENATFFDIQGGFENNGGQTVTFFSITNLVPGPKTKSQPPRAHRYQARVSSNSLIF